MSTYYELICTECEACVPFVGRSCPDRWGWMVGAVEEVPAFVGAHVKHFASLQVISEHDARYGEYREAEA